MNLRSILYGIAFGTLVCDLSAATNHYQVLGVAKTASDREIKRSYYKLALRLHPDKSQACKEQPEGKSCAKDKDKFLRVSKAYEVLSDPERRRVYDMTGSDGDRTPHGAHGASFKFDMGDIGDMFNQFTSGSSGGQGGGFPDLGSFGDILGAFTNSGTRDKKKPDIPDLADILGMFGSGPTAKRGKGKGNIDLGNLAGMAQNLFGNVGNLFGDQMKAAGGAGQRKPNVQRNGQRTRREAKAQQNKHNHGKKGGPNRREL